MIPDQLIVDFKDIFKGNTKAFGQLVWDSEERKHIFTVKYSELTNIIFKEHFEGKIGLALSPILPEGVCWFGAMDFDNHASNRPLDYSKICRDIQANGYPLIACRSKSGGIHVYIFGKEPLNVKNVQRYFLKIKHILSGAGEDIIEIFPKQQKLGHDGIGNMLNLPYFDVDKTERYGWIKGQIIGLKDFLAEAKRIRLTNDELKDLINAGEKEDQAPPCVQNMLKMFLEKGGRNNGVYNYAVYAKKAFHENWQQKVFEFNANNVSPPLVETEIRALITSVSSKNYSYRCNEEPCVGLCDMVKCQTLAFGITKREREKNEVSRLPVISDVRKYMGDPVKWSLKVDGREIMLETEQLITFRLFRLKVLETLSRVLGTIKQDDWFTIVNGLMAGVVEISMPDDTSQAGMIRAEFREYANKVDLTDEGRDMGKRTGLLMQRPIVYYSERNQMRLFVFFGTAFMQHLKFKKTGNLSGQTVWFALQPLGITKLTVRVRDERKGEKVVSCWGVPIEGVLLGFNSQQPPLIDSLVGEFEAKEVMINAQGDDLVVDETGIIEELSIEDEF